MASLTPGILQKLLQNVGDKDARVVGEHRSALLQVIGIVPSLDDDPWKSRGFYLRVSDSMHSAYVSVLDEDVELIMSDKIQLGQFVHVARLDPCSPVPVVCGLKPVPKRRPCLGNPVDLISSDVLTARKIVDSKRVKKCAGLGKKVEVKENLERKMKRLMESEDVKSRRLSMSNGKVAGPEVRRLSLDSMRKGWDQSPQGKHGGLAGSKSKSKQGFYASDSVLDKKKSSSDDPTSKHLLISPLKSKNVIASPKIPSKPTRKDVKSLSNKTFPEHPSEDSNLRNLSQSKILCNSIPDAIHKLGRGVRGYKNAAFSAAVHAIEEASAADGVLSCMRKFAELCELSQGDAAGPFVENFLNLQKDIENAAMVIKALVETRIVDSNSNNSCNSQGWLPDTCCNFINKNALSWVQAAVETDLSKFSLLRKEEKKGIRNGEKCIYLVIENTPKKTETEKSPKIKRPQNNDKGISDLNLKKSSSSSRGILPATKGVNIEIQDWCKGNGLKDAADLAESLLSFSRGWFLIYLENLLYKGSGMSTGEKNPETAGLLGQLKKVNGWLDDSFPQGTRVDERIQDLKKKLYAFLLDNVDSAIQPKR